MAEEAERVRLLRQQLGQQLASLRQASRLSQADLGKVIFRERSLIARLEAGTRAVDRESWEKLDSALDAKGTLVAVFDALEAAKREHEQAIQAEELAEAREATKALQSRAAQGMSAAPFDDLFAQQGVVSEGNGVHRRGFLGVVAGLTAGVLSADRPGSPCQPASMTDGNLVDVIRSMRKLYDALVAQDSVLGPAVVAPTAMYQLAILQQLSHNFSGQSRSALMRLQTSYAEIVGWLADDLGDRRSGQYWIDRALEWAHEADSEIAVAYVLARKAQRTADEGDAAGAISLAQAAARRGEQLPRVQAAALLYGALGHAGSADRSAFRSAIDQANELVANSQQPGDGELAQWCTPGYVIMHEAAGYMRLHEPVKAASTYESGLADWPQEFRREQGLHYSRLARAYAAAGQPEQAITSGRTALRIGVETKSSRTLSQLQKLTKGLDGWKQVPAVARFSKELRELQPALDYSTRTK